MLDFSMFKACNAAIAAFFWPPHPVDVGERHFEAIAGKTAEEANRTPQQSCLLSPASSSARKENSVARTL